MIGRNIHVLILVLAFKSLSKIFEQSTFGIFQFVQSLQQMIVRSLDLFKTLHGLAILKQKKIKNIRFKAA